MITIYVGVAGIRNGNDVRRIGKFVHIRINKPHVRVFLGINVSALFLEDSATRERIKTIVAIAQDYKTCVPVLHVSFANSVPSITHVEMIRRTMPFVRFVQLNDLRGNYITMLNAAVRYFEVIFPLSDYNFSLLGNKNFVKKIIENKVFIILDNSRGTGKRDGLFKQEWKAKKCVAAGIQRIAVAGGFGPAHLRPYFELSRKMKFNFSVDAESRLCGRKGLSLGKTKRYLDRCLKFIR